MSNLPKTILLIADIKNWAFDNIAQYLHQTLSATYEIHILYTEDYSNPKELLKSISQFNKVELIHFFARRDLRSLIEYIADHQISVSTLDYFLDAAITTSVPDHLYLATEQDVRGYEETLAFVDHYYTTSAILNNLYNKIERYPRPWPTIIFDNVIVENIPHFEISEPLTIAWVGNSAWGAWYFGEKYDAKGYHTVIKPALELVRQEITIEVIIADSVEKQRSKQEIAEILRKCDILLIAANTDGTPLPLIEAMAAGCAIISTNTGIVAEVLPEKQQPFILGRQSQDFYAAIKKLHENRALLQQLKQENYQAYQRIFLDETRFQAQWIELIEASITKSKYSQRLDNKRQILQLIKDRPRRARNFLQHIESVVRNNQFLKRAIKYLLKFKIINHCVRTSYLALQNKSFHDNFDFKDQEGIIVIHSGIHPGITNSTAGLFGDQKVITLNINSEYFGLRPSVVRQIITKILTTQSRKIIFSGGNQITLNLLKAFATETNIQEFSFYYLYHGSPAQWTEGHHLQKFHLCHSLYLQGKLQAIISLKKDLQMAFQAVGIKSYLLQNFIPTSPQIIQGNVPETKFTVGLWSAYAVWVKNHYPQIMALSMFNQAVTTRTNFQFSHFDDWLQEKLDVVSYPSEIPHSELMQLINSTHITLYVTNTECSPMIALESLSLGIPCLVGPAAGLYDSDGYLRKMLTVSKVDCPLAIHQAIKKVQDNLTEIKARLPKFVENYNAEALRLKRQLLETL